MCAMKKKYIKMNDLKNHLSLGNVILVIKNAAKNKVSAIQSEVFCALFDIDDISETNVNNYCTGYRAIGNLYIQKYIVLQNKYKKEKKIFEEIIYNILNILEGFIYKEKINDSKKLREVCLKLYNIAKNDCNINENFTNELYTLIQNNDLYNAFIKIICYAILENKQPLYESEKRRTLIEITLENTNISTKDLEKFLSLKMTEGINYYHSLKQLVNENNAYACFELATMEYSGEIAGISRYNICYDLLLKAANQNHPSANWMIANMIINKKIGNGSRDEIKLAWQYLKKAESLGNVAAINTIGICFKNGIGVKKDINKAKRYFEKASKEHYVYALNNLGKYYEENEEFKKAFRYYCESADMGESWAANKIGEMYREGKGTKKDLKKAFEYYIISEDSSIKEICWYSKYNLAKYYYLNGSAVVNIEKNEEKAIKLFTEASLNGIINASIELLYIYCKKYKETNDATYKDLMSKYIDKVETHPEYNKQIKNKIESKLDEISNFDSLKIEV